MIKTPVCWLLAAASLMAADHPLVYIGAYGKGIYAFRFNGSTGALAPLGLVGALPDPSFVAIHPDGKHLYAVSESKNILMAFAIDAASGKLKPLNSAATRGGGPCYVSIDKAGRCALVANYGGGSVAAFPIAPDGGVKPASAFIQDKGSSVNPSRQREPHAHSINASPDDRFAVAADLGTDQLFLYRLDAAAASLKPNDPPFVKLDPGSGPRHFTFHPSGRFAYSINELSSKVTAFTWDAGRGVLTAIQSVSTLPKDFTGENTAAEVQVHPNGLFLYGSNRGHDSIALLAIDPKKGTLTPVARFSTRGRTPRNFAIDPAGAFLVAANQDSDSLVVFRIDAKTGRLTPAGPTAVVPKPVCVRFLATR